MSATPQQMAAKLHRAAVATDKAAKVGVFEGALFAKQTVAASMTSVGVPPGARLNVGRKGSKVNVGFNIKGSANPTALVSMRGPAHLIERPTKPHVIQARKAPGVKARRRGGARALAFGNDEYATSVKHPGTKGKFPWRKAQPAIRKGVPEVIVGAQRAALRKEFLSL